MLLTVAGFAIAGVVGGLLWWGWSLWVMRVGKGHVRRTSGRGLWSRWTGKERYELVDRMA